MKHSGTAAGLMAVAMLATGCGTGGGGAPETAETLATGGKVTGEITFWHSYSEGGAEVKTLKEKVIPAFEKAHPGTKVKPVTVQYDQLHQKLVTAAAGSTLPDVVRSDIIWVPELADLGVLVPLDEAMPDFTRLAAQTYYGALATNLWKGKHYGLPLDTNTKVLLYNPATLAKAGVNAPPATFDELKALAPRLAAKKIYVHAVGDGSGWNVLPLIWSNGGDITDKDVTKSDGHLNAPPAVEAVQLLVDLYAAGGIPKIVLGGGGGTGALEGLAKGIYATTHDGPWNYPIAKAQFPKLELNAAPTISGKGGSVSVVGGESIVITQSSNNKALAAEFTRFMLSPEAQMLMARVGQVSVLKDLADDMASVDPYYAPYMKQLETARPRPATPAWAKVDAILTKQVQLAIKGDLTAQAAMDAAVAQIDPLLERARAGR